MGQPMLRLMRQAKPAPSQIAIRVSQAVSEKIEPPVMPAPTVQPPASTAPKPISTAPIR